MSFENWVRIKLCEIAQINANSISKDYPYHYIEYIDTSSVVNNVFEAPQKMKLSMAPSRARRIVQQGDTIISTVRPIQRHFGFINNPNPNTVVSTGFAVISPNKIYPEFLYYYLSQDCITNYLDGIAETSTTTFPAFKPEVLSNLVMVIPKDTLTQKRIADILSTLDEKIEINRKVNATLEAMAQAIFKEWFVDFNFPGATGEMVESELGMIPKGWKVVSLGEITDLSWGDTTTTKDSYTSEGFIAYSASGPDGYLPYFDYERKGIVVSAIGAYSGKTWFALEKWSCIKNTIRFWSTDADISDEYLFLLSSGNDFWPLRGSAQPFISQTDARNLKIIYPRNQISRLFGKITQPIFLMIQSNIHESITLSQTRDSLLPKLMSGVIDVLR